MQHVRSLLVLTIVITMASDQILAIVEDNMDSVDVVVDLVMALVEAVAVAMVVEPLEVAMARRNPPTIIPTSTVDIVKELVMIFTSAGSMPRNKRKERRTIVLMMLATRVEALRLLVGQSNINQALFALILLHPLM